MQELLRYIYIFLLIFVYLYIEKLHTRKMKYLGEM